MKVCVVQPYYSFNAEDLDRCYRDMLTLTEQCDASMDLIVLPEYCDIPAATKDAAAFHASIARYNADIREKAASLARRCHAIVFANFADITEAGPRNTTFAFDRDGNIVGKYYKAHPAPSETKTAKDGGNEMDCTYSYRYEKPYTVEIEGIRFGFMTCYDFYMYEGFASLARQNVDIIIGCSHQRTDTRTALDLIGRFLSYNTNAYLVRSAVTLGEDSPVCGCSMIVAPTGDMLLNMENRTGLGIYEIDPAVKYKKPAGFRGALRSHYEYIDEGRRPWLYRPGGSMTVPGDRVMPYPRICAHRGFSSVAPENSLPAFGAAIALGAEEIEFDLRETADGEVVSVHDHNLDRLSTGHGELSDHTYAELLTYDFGIRYGERFRSLRIARFDEILSKFACHAVMNVHLYPRDPDNCDAWLGKILDTIDEYDCRRHVYFMVSEDQVLRRLGEIAPDIPRCVGFDFVKDDPLRIVRRAIALGCEKVQLYKPYFTEETVAFAHENGILCNVFYADDPDEARRYRAMGIDTILTNDYLQIRNALSEK